ncbi:MAG: triose-phosphate isomerase [Candidatus Moranbacteria bacterium]|jgi:triosephosphate isomerase|nr:triose-phosphate isomerase [Candidatus Moranbacteria bacterium]
MTTKIIVGNLKMNLITLSERDGYLKLLKSEIKKLKNDGSWELILCVPFVHLDFFSKNLKGKNIYLGVQNIFWDERGSFTGEISPVMARECGAKYSIVGHSERRRYFKENDQEVNKKIKVAIQSQITPIMCIGETSDERKEGLTKDVISRQLLDGLEGILPLQSEKIIIAYEPVWSVGSDIEPESNEIMEVRILVRKLLTQKYGEAVAGKVKVLYGGSVKSKLIKKVCFNPQMDGVLVGRESLVPVNLIEIVQSFSQC